MIELRPIERLAEHTLALAKYPEAQPYWVADMSFATPEPILSAVKKRVEEGHFSYPNISHSVYESIQSWCKKQYDWTIDKDWIVVVSNTMTGVRAALNSTYTKGPIFVQTPNYYKISNMGCGFDLTQRKINLRTNSKPFNPVDFRNIRRARPSAIVLCNPTNPTGIVSTKIELEMLANRIKDLDTIIISDEAHADLILGDRHHIPAGSVKGLESKSITILSPSKAFNLAGISVAYAVIPSELLRKKFIATQAYYSTGINALGLVALEHAYSHCSDWLRILLRQLKENQRILHNGLTGTPLKYTPANGTYLAWIDTREAGEQVFEKLLQRGIAVSDGVEFGSPGWIRLNFACPQNQLKFATDTISSLFGRIR